MAAATFTISPDQEIQPGRYLLITLRASAAPNAGFFAISVTKYDGEAIRKNLDSRRGISVLKVRQLVGGDRPGCPVEVVARVTESTSVTRSIPASIYAGEQWWTMETVEQFQPGADPLAARGSERVGEIAGNIGSGIAATAGWAKWVLPLALVVILAVYAAPYLPRGAGR